MNRKLHRTLLFILATAPAFAFSQTRTSVANGALSSPATWDCSCVPTSSASLVIKHDVYLTASSSFESITVELGGHFRKIGTGKLVVNGDLVIKAGGQFTNDLRVDVFGDYEVSGIHAGTKPIWLRGHGTEIRGNIGGNITNTHSLELMDGDKTIRAGSVITKNSGRTIIDGITVTNNGSFQAEALTGSSGSEWVQGPNSWFGVSKNIQASVSLFASAPGNVVQYNMMTTDIQLIAVPQGEQYDRLELLSNGTTKQKRLTGTIKVNSDLLINNCTFDVRHGLTNHDLSVGGNWTNDGAIFRPRKANVTFIPTGSVAIQHASSEQFNNLFIAGSGAVSLQSSIDIGGNLTVSSTLDAGIGAHKIQLAGNANVTGQIIPGNSELIAMGSSDQTFTGQVDLFDLTAFNSGSGVKINSGETSVAGTLAIRTGTVTTNDRLLMRSNADGDSRIAETTMGSIIGKITAQRYIDAGATNWRFLTSPVSGVTLANWKDDFIMSGFPGSQHPSFSFVSVYSHDETAPGTLDDGFIAASSITDPLVKGKGYWVWCGDNMAGTQPFMIDLKGKPYVGDIDLPVSYTAYGSAPDDGWNMVGNPYVSVIDWDSPNWVKTNVNNTVSIWNPDMQQFSTYIDGVSTNGGSRYIASSQAFWVHTNGASPKLTIKEGSKSAMAAGFKSAGPAEVLRLKLSGQGLADETVVRVDDRATIGFDSGLDALEMISPNTNAPNVYTQTSDGRDVQVNAIPAFNIDTAMYISVEVGVADNYTLSVEEVGLPFTSSCLVIEDLETDQTTALVEGGSLTFFMDPDNNGQRFMLYMSKPLDVQTVATSCSNGDDGSITVSPSGPGPWDIDVTDLSSQIIASIEQVSHAVTFDSLAAGSYYVIVTGQGLCAELSTLVIVDAPAAIEIETSITHTTCAQDNNGSIALAVSGGQAPYQYQWSNGSTSSVANSLPVGIHSVQVTDAAMCLENSILQIEAAHQVEALFNAPSNAQAGQLISPLDMSQGADQLSWDMGDGSALQVTATPSHTYALPGSYDITLTASAGPCQDVHTRTINVEGTVGVEDEQPITGVDIIQIGDQLFVTNVSGQTKELSVSVRNVLGQLLVTNVTGTYGTGNTQIAMPYAAEQMMLVTVTDDIAGSTMTKKIVR